MYYTYTYSTFQLTHDGCKQAFVPPRVLSLHHPSLVLPLACSLFTPPEASRSLELLQHEFNIVQ